MTLPPGIILRRGHWYASVHFPTIEKSANGRKKYIQVRIRCNPETEERARELVAQIRADYAAIKDKGPVVTLEDLCNRFLDAKRGTVTHRTHDYYTKMARHITGDIISRSPFDTITVLEVQGFYQRMRKSPTMIRKVNILLSMIYNQAAAWELTVRNPTKGVLLPGAPVPEIQCLERAEARAFIAACETDPKYFIFIFALETWMRPQEYLALKWSDIDLTHRKVNVRRALSDDLIGGGREIKTTKTFSGRRVIAISERLVEGLLLHKRAQASTVENLRAISERSPLLSHMKRKGKNYQKRIEQAKHCKEHIERFETEDLVFPGAKGGFQSLNNLSKRSFEKVANLAGLKGLTVYSLRHTGITLALAAGANINSVSQRAGHRRASFTLNTYGHVLTHAQRQTSSLLEEELYG